MIVLAFVWLALFVLESALGLRPWMEALGVVIWALFAVEFALGLALAPARAAYLRRNWLKAVALLLPAFRLLRVFRVLRLARLARAGSLVRGGRLLRIVSSLNRGMRALRASVGNRGAPYVFALTLLVTFAGAAGMYAFENESRGGRGFDGFGDALWWTAMVMTTMGSSYWPETTAGRVLCLLLSLYAFGVFGYVTAIIASALLGRDLTGSGGDTASRVEALDARLASVQASLDRIEAAKDRGAPE